jgi:hypothetical protein
MVIPRSKAELLQLIDQEHAKLDDWIARLAGKLLSKRGVKVGWTGREISVAVKDVLVHLTMWEKRMLAYIKRQTEGTPSKDPRYSLTAPKFNTLIYEENRNCPASVVLRDYRRTYKTVIRTISKLDDATAAKLERGPIRYNTYNHYRWAIKKVRPFVRMQQQRKMKAT